jgi:hypothetical protein
MGVANFNFRNFNTKSHNLSHCTYNICIIQRNHTKLLRTAAILCYFETSYNIVKNLPTIQMSFPPETFAGVLLCAKIFVSYITEYGRTHRSDTSEPHNITK